MKEFISFLNSIQGSIAVLGSGTILLLALIFVAWKYLPTFKNYTDSIAKIKEDISLLLQNLQKLQNTCDDLRTSSTITTTLLDNMYEEFQTLIKKLISVLSKEVHRK